MSKGPKGVKEKIGDWSEKYLGHRCPAHIFASDPWLDQKCGALVEAVSSEVREKTVDTAKNRLHESDIRSAFLAHEKIDQSGFGKYMIEQIQSWVSDQIRQIGDAKSRVKCVGSDLWKLEADEAQWINIYTNSGEGLKVVLRTIREYVHAAANGEVITPEQLRALRDSIPAIPVFVSRFEGSIARILERDFFQSGFIKKYQGVISVAKNVVGGIEQILDKLRDRAMKKYCPAYPYIEQFSLAVFDIYCEVYEHFYRLSQMQNTDAQVLEEVVA